MIYGFSVALQPDNLFFVFLGALLGTLVGVPSKFVNLLANVPRGLMNVLEARKKNLESQA